MTQVKEKTDEVKGVCMSCGLIIKGATRALVEGQFSWHNEERHKRKLNAMETIVLRFFTGEPPKMEERKKREKRQPWNVIPGKKKRVVEKTPMNAEWI